MAAPAELEIIGQAVEFTTQNWEWMVGFGSFLVLGAIGLNFRQRQKILERDDHKCQHPNNGLVAGPKDKDGQVILHVHHIQAKEYEHQRGVDPHVYNDPANLITLSKNYHVAGGPKCKHPDIHQANEDYRNGDKDAINRVLKDHHEKAKRGEKYWSTESDVELHKIAAENNKKMDEKHGGRKGWWNF